MTGGETSSEPQPSDARVSRMLVDKHKTAREFCKGGLPFQRIMQADFCLPAQSKTQRHTQFRQSNDCQDPCAARDAVVHEDDTLPTILILGAHEPE